MKQLLDQGRRALQEGRWVIIFPEGTRVALGERKAYGIGGALLAERSGRPVVPIAHNAGVFWGRRSLLKRPGVIELKIGAPIPAGDRGATEINREAERWIEETVAELPTHPG
jgi:1-acyl-sn-glycerol-3-phosphate acyltransferase